MNFSGLNFCDTANGPGCRVSLFVSGCTNRCKGCFSPHTWDFDAGELFARKQMKEILDKSEPDYIRGLSILGGEPMHPKNSGAVLDVVREYRDRFGDKKDIWLWTGYEFQHLYQPLLDCRMDDFFSAGYLDYPKTEEGVELTKLVDVFVCGRFDESKKDLTLPYRGSSNQYLVFRKEGEPPNYWCRDTDNDVISEKIKKTGPG